jgi:colanic acid/amylovoran biosynthesis glycosyltransferase
MNKEVVHVLDIFPSKSETFIVNHIVECEKQGYKSIILVNVLNPINQSSQTELIISKCLYEVTETYNPKFPQNKILRAIEAVKILLKNVKDYKVFFRTLNHKKFGLKSKTLKMWFQAGVFIKYKNIAVFHAHFGKNGKLLAEMKSIGAIHGDIITSFYGYDTFSVPEKREDLKVYYKDLFLKSKTFITSSQYLNKNLQKLNVPENKLLINPVGVDLTKFQYNKRIYKGVLNIITVGRLIDLKGQRFGIDAVNLLLKKGYKINYTIVGYGEEEDSLKQQIIDLGLSDNITVFGSASQIEIANLLSNNHIFLMTSITDKYGRAEGQGLVSAEAQATGMAVVAFDSGGIAETIDNNITGFLVEQRNINLMTKEVEKFILDPTLINKMGYEAMLFVKEHFNSYEQSKKIIQLYN